MIFSANHFTSIASVLSIIPAIQAYVIPLQNYSPIAAQASNITVGTHASINVTAHADLNEHLLSRRHNADDNEIFSFYEYEDSEGRFSVSGDYVKAVYQYVTNLGSPKTFQKYGTGNNQYPKHYSQGNVVFTIFGSTERNMEEFPMLSMNSNHLQWNGQVLPEYVKVAQKFRIVFARRHDRTIRFAGVVFHYNDGTNPDRITNPFVEVIGSYESEFRTSNEINAEVILKDTESTWPPAIQTVAPAPVDPVPVAPAPVVPAAIRNAWTPKPVAASQPPKRQLTVLGTIGKPAVTNPNPAPQSPPAWGEPARPNPWIRANRP